jgi:cyd operon protein YbgT
MWYFSWILGVGLACSFAILNAMWFEMREDRLQAAKEKKPRKAGED